MLPKVPKGFVTNFPNAVPDFIGPRQFIFLLASVAIFLLISTIFLAEQVIGPRQKQVALTAFVESFKNETALLDFPSSLWEKRFYENLDIVAKETDTQKQFEALSANFPILMGIYNTSHDSKVRIQAEHLAQFIQQEFADQAQNQNFNISCLDLDCGQPKHSEEMLILLGEISQIQGIDKTVLASISKKIEEAGFNSDQTAQFYSYFSAFSALASYARDGDDPKVLEVATKFRDFLKKNYPENYTTTEQDFSGVFTL